MLNLLLCVISVLAAPNPDINLFLGLEEHLIVNVVKIGPREHLHCLIFKYGFNRDYFCFGAVPSDSLRLIVYSILVECLNILVDMPEDSVQVEYQQELIALNETLFLPFHSGEAF